MTRILISTFIVFATAFSVLGSEPKISKASATSDERKVLALNQEWADAEVRHDEAALQRILDDRFIVTDDEGKTKDKAAFIEETRHFSMISQTLADDTVRIHGHTAIVVGTSTIRFRAKGQEQALVIRYTAVYIKRHGQWRAIAEQFGRLASAK